MASVYTILKSTTLESNMSPDQKHRHGTIRFRVLTLLTSAPATMSPQRGQGTDDTRWMPHSGCAITKPIGDANSRTRGTSRRWRVRQHIGVMRVQSPRGKSHHTSPSAVAGSDTGGEQTKRTEHHADVPTPG
jgi:hypothetical protein